MHKVVVTLAAIVGLLGWIACMALFFTTGIERISVALFQSLPTTLIQVAWLKDLVGALKKSINSQEKWPYFFWTILPFTAIFFMVLSWVIAPNTAISYLALFICAALLVVDDVFTEDTIQQRIIRYLAYVFLILALVFFSLAMNGQGKFVDTFAANFATEFGGLAIGLLVLDELYRWRDKANQKRIDESIAAERKRNIIQQMGSRSNDFALDAARIAAVEGWLRDGSLVEVNLAEASLQNANLRFANLQSAYLNDANLQHSNLTIANLQSASLPYANLQHADLSAANLQRANLWGADLQHARLLGVKLENAILLSANLQHANLWGANLQHVDLMFAKLQNAVLLNADLLHADLRGSNLQQAILSVNDVPESHYKQILIHQEQSPKQANFLNAKYNSATIWPDGFDPVAAGAILID